MGNVPGKDGERIVGGDGAAPQNGVISGFRVCRVASGGLADACGVEPYFDFLTHINKTPLSSPQSNISTILNQQIGSPVYIHIFNAKTRQFRCVCVTPRPTSNGQFSLGASVYFDKVSSIDSEGLRILGVHPSSPAEKAGLKPVSDWILGSPQYFFKTVDDLYGYITGEETKLLKEGRSRDEFQIEFLLYNSEDQKLRYVTLFPRYDWGGKGCIGLDIGTGALHQLRFAAPPNSTAQENPTNPTAPSDRVKSVAEPSATVSSESLSEVPTQVEMHASNQSNHTGNQNHQLVQQTSNESQRMGYPPHQEVSADYSQNIPQQHPAQMGQHHQQQQGQTEMDTEAHHAYFMHQQHLLQQQQQFLMQQQQRIAQLAPDQHYNREMNMQGNISPNPGFF